MCVCGGGGGEGVCGGVWECGYVLFGREEGGKWGGGHSYQQGAEEGGRPRCECVCVGVKVCVCGGGGGGGECVGGVGVCTLWERREASGEEDAAINRVLRKEQTKV